MLSVFGEIDSALPAGDLAELLDAGDWRASSGRYAIRLHGPDCACALEADDGGYLIRDGIDGSDEIAGARSLSGHLAARGLRHRIEVYDAESKLVAYFHREWPRAERD